MTKQEIKTKLLAELNSLTDRTNRLTVFIRTKKFLSLEKNEQELLLSQEKIMKTYQEILINRLALVQDFIDDKEEKINTITNLRLYE